MLWAIKFKKGIKDMGNRFNPVYRGLYITAAVFFAVLYALCMALFYSVTYEAAGVIMNFMRALSFVFAGVVVILVSVRCAAINKIKSPEGFDPPRDAMYYIKRVCYITLMIFLMSLAASMVGMVVATLFGGIFYRIENTFFSEFLLKLPVFILYLSFVYKMLVRFGFMDSQRKIYNLNLRTLAFIIAFILLLPGLIHANYFYAPALATDGTMNVQTIISPCAGTYITEFDGLGVFRYENEDFGTVNMILIGLTSLLTFAVQLFFFRFAYDRGKKIFIKQHIRQLDEYKTDENI